MKQLALSRENLITLGLDPNATTEEIKEWAKTNEDIVVDFKNKIIHYGLIQFKVDSENFIAQLKNELQRNYSSHTVKRFTEIINKETAADLNKVLSTIPLEQKSEFMLKMFNQMREKLKDLQDDYDNSKINEFLNKSYVNKELEDKKAQLLKVSKTPEVKKLISDILHTNISNFSIINYIEKNTTKKTRHLFLKEIYTSYRILVNEFMFSVKEADIAEALKIFEHRLDYVYVSNYELTKVNTFVRDINHHKTIFNAWNLSKEPFEGSIKLVHLNNIMITYFDEYYEHQIPEFGNMIKYRDVCELLKAEYNIETKKNQIKSQGNIEVADKLALINKGLDDNSKKEPHNPYPRIFKNSNAYLLFQRLNTEFGNTKENLSNYSYVFHKMTHEDLIHYNVLHKTYIDMLSELDIHIDRIKPKKEIGKQALRLSIYNTANTTT